jgi:hypothetical protein
VWTEQGDDEHTPTVLIGTNWILVARSATFGSRGRVTEPGAPAFEDESGRYLGTEDPTHQAALLRRTPKKRAPCH